MSEILIFDWVWGEQGYCRGGGGGGNRVTVDFGADINNELSRRKQDISVR